MRLHLHPELMHLGKAQEWNQCSHQLMLAGMCFQVPVGLELTRADKWLLIPMGLEPMTHCLLRTLMHLEWDDMWLQMPVELGRVSRCLLLLLLLVLLTWAGKLLQVLAEME